MANLVLHTYQDPEIFNFGIVNADNRKIEAAVNGAVPWAVMSNTNILINPYFLDPINQRGQTEYSTTSSSPIYTIDHWYLIAGAANLAKVIVNDGYLTIQRNGSGVIEFDQFVENFNFLLGKTVTYTVLEDNSLATLTYTFPSEMPTNSIVSPEGSASNILISFYSNKSMMDRNLVLCRVALKSGSTHANIVAGKLELGDHQTLAHQDANGNLVLNDPAPDKALELAKCQRYFRVINIDKYVSHQFGLGMATAADQVRLIYNLPLQMRITPTVTTIGKFKLALNMNPASAALLPVTLVNSVGGDSQTIMLRAYGTVTIGYLYSLVPDNEDIGQIILNSEIN